MENGCWGVASGGIGHHMSFKITTQGHLKKKCDLTKNFHKLYVSLGRLTIRENEKWVLGCRPWWDMSHLRWDRSHFRSHYSRHVTKKIDLTKNFDQVCVWYDWIGYIPESMDNGC